MNVLEAPAVTLSQLIPDKDTAVVNEPVTWSFDASGARTLAYGISDENGAEIAAGELTDERQIVWRAPAAGDYALTLTAAGWDGQTQTAYSFLTVTASELTASLSTAARSAFANEDALTFESGILGGTMPYAVTYRMDVAGATVYGSDVFAETFGYSPAEYGAHTLTMTVTDAAGATSVAQVTVPVAVRETESETDWQGSVSAAALTGAYAADLSAVAATQLGYTESARNFIVGETGETFGYTRYGDWFGEPYADWNTLFVSFCAAYAGIPQSVLPTAADAAALKEAAGDLYAPAQEGGLPLAGDIVFLAGGDAAAERVGIVQEVADNGDGSYRIRTVEGDLAGTVGQAEYGSADGSIIGYINMNLDAADAQAQADQAWLDLAAAVTLTNDWRNDLVAVAASQIGYQESASNAVTDETGETRGYTLYGNLLGDPFMPWDVAFAAFCVAQSGVTDAPTAGDAQSWLAAAQSRGMFYAASGYSPLPGDLVFLDTNADGAADRVEIVETAPNGGQFSAVAGDADGAVSRVARATDDTAILGYENPETTLTDAETGVSVTGVLPAAAVLSVTPISSKDPSADADVDATAVTAVYDENDHLVRTITYDITLGGYQPCKNVKVTIPVPQDFGDDLSVYYLDADSHERVEEMQGQPLQNGDGYTFTTSHFSDYAVVSVTAAASSTPAALNTVNTLGIIDVDMFDYGPSNPLDYNTNTYSSPSYSGINSGKNKTTQLLFWPSGQTPSGVTNLNVYTGGPTARTGIVKSTLATNGFPVLNTSNPDNLAYLFDTGTGATGKTSYANTNYLFLKDDNGYYTYNSASNYAYLDTSSKNFTVYNGTYTNINDDGSIGFFPFNAYDSSKQYVGPGGGSADNVTYTDPVYNHHFGMAVSMDFTIPEGGLINGTNDMVFTFSGDDDMWVFIDGVLILDLGGIHNAISGTINFRSGAISTGSTLASKFSAAGKTWNGGDYSNHTIKCFYLERGGMYSNLQLTFNLLTIAQKNIRIAKTVDVPAAYKSEFANTDFNFKLYVQSALGSTTYTLYNGTGYLNGTTATTITNGAFNLKDGQYMEVRSLAAPLKYYVVEQNVNTSVFPTTTNTSQGDNGYTTKIATVDNRPSVTFTNTVYKETKDILVKKTWTDGSAAHTADSIQFSLYANGTLYTYNGSTVFTLNSANNWQMTFTGLPTKVYTHDIAYTVVETTGVSEYDVTYPAAVTSGSTVTLEIVNTPTPQTVTVQKAWQNLDGSTRTSGIPSSVDVTLMRKSQQNVETSGPVVSHTVKFYMYGSNGTNVYMGSKEVGDNGSITFYTHIWVVPSSAKANNVSIPRTGTTSYNEWWLTNIPIYTLSSITSDVSVYVVYNSAYVDQSTLSYQYYEFVIQSYTAPGPSTTTDLQWVTDPSFNDTQTLNSGNGWAYTWTVDRLNSDGYPYYYFVAENTVPDGYAVSYSANNADGITQGTLTVTNRCTYIPVEKVWVGGAAVHGSPSVTVQLTANGTAITGQTTVLNSANNWKSRFVNVAYDSSKTYGVVEVPPLTGYTVTVTGSAASGFTVTNEKKIGVTVTKVWNDSDATHPSVTVKLFKQEGAGGAVQDTGQSVTLPQGGSWTYTFAGLPQYTAAGVEILYTVTEAAPPEGYQSAVGDPVRDAAGNYAFTITNTKRYNVTVEKRDSASGATLAGAEFDLYLETGVVSDGAIPGATRSGSAVYGVKQNADAYVTGSDGRITLASLLTGTYWLAEIKPPGGYFAPTNSFGFTLNTDGSIGGLTDTALTQVSGSGSSLLLIVKNVKGYVLPDTGGPGTTFGTGLGLALIALSGFMYITGRLRKRRGKEGNSFSP